MRSPAKYSVELADGVASTGRRVVRAPPRLVESVVGRPRSVQRHAAAGEGAVLGDEGDLADAARASRCGSARADPASHPRQPGRRRARRGLSRRRVAGAAAASRAAYSCASSSEAYLVRGQKKPRRPSPLVRGTTWTCRCGTDCETTLLTATNEPCAPRPATTAPDTRWAAPIRTGSSSAGRSTRVSTWILGTSRTCPLNTGRVSRKPSVNGSSSTTVAGSAPSMIRQKRQSTQPTLDMPRL